MRRMNELLVFAQENPEMILLFAADIFLAFLLLIALHKINKTKKMLKNITEAVENYLQEILAEEEQSAGQISLSAEQSEQKSSETMSKEEEQNRLISAVLQEIFP